MPIPGATPHVIAASWRDRWNPDAGGAEVWLDEVLRRLAARGWRVTVLTAAHGRRPRRETVDGVDYVRRGGTYSQYPLAHVSRARLDVAPDVVLDVFNGVPFLNTLHPGAPTVVLVHHVHREQWPLVFGRVVGALGWALERVAGRLQRGRRHLTVSEASARDIAATYGVPPGRIDVAHNGLTPVAAEAGSVELVPADRRLVVLGRLVPHKRVEVAIAALAAARSAGFDVHLDVVGEGEWRPDLVREVERRDVGPHVTIHGHLDEADKHAVLAASDLLLLASVREGWGIVVVEAAQHGVPTVAMASAGGTRESVVDGLTGELAADPTDLVRRTLALLGDRERLDQLGRGARRHADRFSWEETTDVVDRVLREAIGEA